MVSVRANNQYDYWPIIGFAFMKNPHQYHLLVSANKELYIGNLTDMLNHMWPNTEDGRILRLGVPKLSNLFGKNILEQNLFGKLCHILRV